VTEELTTVEFAREIAVFHVGSPNRQAQEWTMERHGYVSMGLAPIPFTSADALYGLSSLVQIWRKVVGVNVWDARPTSDPVNGQGLYSAEYGQVIYTRVEVTERGQYKRLTVGPPDYYDCGYVRFKYTAGSGPLRPLRFDKAIFYPETDGAIGLEYFLTPDTEITITLAQIEMPAPGCYFGEEHIVNLLANQAEGLIPLGETIDLFSLSLPGSNTGAYVDENTNMRTQIISYDERVIEVPDGGDSGPSDTLKFHLLSQIWERCCASTVGIATELFHDREGAGLVYASAGFVKALAISCDIPPDDASCKYGNTGAPYAGRVAFAHGDYIEEPYTLNSDTNVLVPRGPEATGLWYCLKNGVVASGYTVTDDHFVRPTQGPYGDYVDALNGVRTGLDYI